MKLKIEFVKENERTEDQRGLSVEFHSRRGDTPIVDRAITLSEGRTEMVNVLPGQMIVIKAAADPKSEVVYDQEQKAAVRRDSLPADKQATATPLTYPSDTPPNMQPQDKQNPGPSGQPTNAGTTMATPVAQASVSGGEARQAGLEGNLLEPNPGKPLTPAQMTEAQMKEAEAQKAKGQTEGQASAQGQATQQPTSQGRTFSIPSKPQESGEKDSAGNPIPKVDNRGPLNHAPPPNETKKD